MHKRAMDFDEFLRQGLIHQVVENDRFWSARPGRLDQRYEDLIADPSQGVEQIAAFLGIAIEPGEADEIASDYSFERNRKRTADLQRRLRESVGDLSDPSLAQVYDGKTLLHWNHLRDGRPGGWRELATPRQREAMHRVVGHWLVAHGYESDDSWVERRRDGEARSSGSGSMPRSHGARPRASSAASRRGSRGSPTS